MKFGLPVCSASGGLSPFEKEFYLFLMLSTGKRATGKRVKPSIL